METNTYEKNYSVYKIESGGLHIPASRSNRVKHPTLDDAIAYAGRLMTTKFWHSETTYADRGFQYVILEYTDIYTSRLVAVVSKPLDCEDPYKVYMIN